MAAPSYTEDLTDITLAENTTGWSALGGGASGLAAGPDFAMEGTNCVDKQVTASEKGQVFAAGAGIAPGANTHFFVWAFLATPGLANTLANRGLAIIIGTGLAAYNAFHVEGSNTYGAAGRVGKCYPIRYVTTGTASPPYRTLTGSPGANPQYFGATANITGTVKGANLGVDAIRYGTGGFITAGEVANPATFAGFQAANDATSARWGIFTLVGGSYELQGRFVIGQNNAGTPTLAYFNDSNRNIIILDTPHSLTDFTQIIIDHASTQVYWTNINITALGTNNPGRIVVNNGTTVSFTTCFFTSIGITTLTSIVTALNCTWRLCGAITAAGADLSGSSVLTPNVTADTSGLIWNTATDPDGYLDDMTFSKGTTAHHAIEFGTSSPTSITLRRPKTSGFNASNGQNDSTFHIKRTTGTVTINIIGGVGNFTYKTDGATVVIVIDPVTTTVVVRDENGALLANAAILLYASDGTGDLPYQESVTITRSGSVATVSHTAHGMATNHYVRILGCNQQEYNGVKQITVIDANSYTFAVTGTPATPATGTPQATGVIISGTTSGTGQLSDTRTFSNNQPVTGWVRKGTSAPYYQEASLAGNTISSSAGLTINVKMIPDG